MLVSSTNPGTCDMDYSCYRLQVCKVETNIPLADSYHELKPYCVITKEAIHGPLKNGARSVGPISSVFLAGASFDFDLLSSSKNSEDDEDEMIVTLGIVRSPGGIEAVNLTGTNKAFISSILDDNEVSKICLADIMGCNNANPYNGRNVLINAFVWTIELLNGHLYCWTVPYKLRGRKGMDMHLPLFFRDERMARPKGLCPPHLVCTKESREKRIRYNLGIICHIGRSSDWMQQSSSGTQSDISLGLVPDSGFGCVLRAGQDARTLHRSGIGGDFDTDLFASDFLESEVYGPSEFLMMPPVFVPSLYMLLLEAAFLRTQPKLETGSELDSTSNLFEDEKARLEVSSTSDNKLDDSFSVWNLTLSFRYISLFRRILIVD